MFSRSRLQNSVIFYNLPESYLPLSAEDEWTQKQYLVNFATERLPWYTLTLWWWKSNYYLIDIAGEKDRLSYNNKAIPLDDGTQKIVDELMLYTRRKEWKCERAIQVFWSNTQDPVVRGTTRARDGSFIGLPYSFSYQNIADIDTSNIVHIGNKDFDWESRDEDELLSSLILSESAKKFAIARELHFIKNDYYMAVHHLTPLLCIALGLYSSYKINRSSFFKNIKRSFRALTIIPMALVLFDLRQEYLKVYFKKLHLNADTQAAGMGQEYAIGGIEYFTKVLKRNQALRTLNGYNGAHKFTPSGDEIEKKFSMYKIPVSLHLRHVVEQTKNLYGEENKNLNEIIDSIVKDDENE